MMRVYAPVLILVCSLAVLAAATTYCGTEPVSYTLYEPNDRAGFVFSSNVASVTCGLATVSSGVATGINVNAFCAFFDEQGNEYAEALLQQAPTNGYTSMPFEISCPVGSRAQIAVSNTFATQSAPINVTYNFELSNAGSVSKVPFVYRHAAALAGPATVDYCGVAPVSYVLHGPGYYAGFVWPSNQITLSCGLSTTSNAYSTGIQVHAYCSFSQSAETILQQIPTNGYFSGSLLLTCPEGSSVIVATSNSLATSFVPINATYNFEATATDGSYLAKTPVFRSSK